MWSGIGVGPLSEGGEGGGGEERRDEEIERDEV